MSSRRPVVVVGVGGLGCPALVALAAAFAETERPPPFILCDAETVELSNLHRQILFGDRDLGRVKVEVARERLLSRTPHLDVTARRERLSGAALTALCASAAVVLDCTDDPETKLALNDACVREARPLVHAGVVRLAGHVLAVLPGVTPCVRCLWDELDADPDAASCAADGVLGPAGGRDALDGSVFGGGRRDREEPDPCVSVAGRSEAASGPLVADVA